LKFKTTQPRIAIAFTARYLLAVRKLTEPPGQAATELKILQEFCHDLVALRRGGHCAARLKIEQARRSQRCVKEVKPWKEGCVSGLRNGRSKK
jgi:hypothetical protein